MSDEGFTPDPQPNRKPATVAEDGFTPDAPVAESSAPVDDGFVPDGAPAAQAATPSWAPTDVALNSLKGVAAVLEPFSLPLRHAAAQVAKQIGLEVENKPLSIYPGSAPTTQWSDIIDYGADKVVADKALMEWALKEGYSAKTAAMMVAGKKTAVFGAGLLADFFGDPMMYVGVGIPNKATRGALEAGKDIEKIERSTIALTTPIRGKVISAADIPGAKNVAELLGKDPKNLSKITAEVTIPSVNKAAQKGVDAVKRIVYAPFDWRTGDHMIDAGSVLWAGRRAGVPQVIQEEFAVPFLKAAPTADEIKIMTNVAETTPNLRPELKGLNRELTPAEEAALGTTKDHLRSQVAARIQRAAQEEGVKITPGRELVIEDLMMKAKEMNAKAIVARERRGKIDYSRPLNEQLMENYSPHVKTPEARKAMRGAEAEEIRASIEQGKLAKEAEAMMNGGGLTNFGPSNKQRQIRVPVREANERLRNSGKTGERLREAGVDKMFQENPYIASYENLMKQEKSALDQEFIKLMNERGFNYVEMVDGKRLSRPRVEFGNDEAYKRMNKKQREWVDNAVSKLQHQVAPLESSMGRKMLEAYNNVFRTTTLLKPNYYVQNFGDSLVKNAIQGVGPKSYLDAYKVWTGKGTIKLNGKVRLASDVRKELIAANAMNMGHFGETFDAAVNMGKRATADGASLEKGGKGFKQLMENIRAVGSSGENWARSSMVLDRLDRGYNLTQAMYDMENFHFNFSRTTKRLDELRLVAPFAQFPVKTLGIAGDLLLKKPGIANQQYFLTEQLDRAINDPLESATLKAMIPDFAKWGNAVPVGDAGYFMKKAGNFVDNMIGGNSFFAKAFLPPNQQMDRQPMAGWVDRSFNNPEEPKNGLPQNQAYFKLPVGSEAVNQWLNWESGGPFSGPIATFFQALATGKDQFTGVEFDPNPKKPNVRERFKGAGWNAATSAVNFPAMKDVIMQEMGMVDSMHSVPAANRLFRSMFGGPNGFMDITNADRSMGIKAFTLDKMAREQEKRVVNLYIKEKATGKLNTSAYSTVPATTAKEAFEELLELKPEIAKFQQLTSAYKKRPQGPLVDPRTKKAYANQALAKAVADLKGIRAENKKILENWVAVKTRMMDAMKEEANQKRLSREQLLESYKLRDMEETPEEMLPQAEEPDDAPEPEPTIVPDGGADDE